jgi:5-methylcytosine-specific restriction endonuclease McrA
MIKNKKICQECKKETFIWSKNLCKNCFTKINPPKKIQYKSAKQKIKDIEKKEYTSKQFSMFYDIWAKRRHYCESCGLWLGNEPLSIFFDHLLEKSKYEQFALMEENIFLCCYNCHSKKTNGFPTEKHKKAIEQAKIKFL